MIPPSVSSPKVKGFTLFESMLVLLIIAIGSVLVYPSVQKGIENRKAKQALGTLRTISNAMRLYEINQGIFPPNLTTLENAGYVKSDEYAPDFNYSININTTVSPPVVSTSAQNSSRTVTLTQDPNIKGQDGTVTDSASYLDSTTI